MRRLLLSVLLGAMTVSVCATITRAETLTLDDCIELALKNRVSIIQARGEERIAKWDQAWALGQFLPNMSASYNYSKGRETNIDPANVVVTAYDSTITTTVIGSDTAKDVVRFPTQKTYNTSQDIGPNKSWNFSASMDVVDLTNWFNYFGARQSRAKAHLDVINSEQDLIYSVKLSYYAYLAAVENVDVQKQAVQRSEEQLKLINSRFELGSASKSDVLKQKVQVGNDELALLEAQNSVVTSKATLAYTIGIDPNREDVEFSTEYTTREFDGTLDDAMKFGLSKKPGLLSAEKDLAAAKHALRSRWASYLPTLSASYSYTRSIGTVAYPVVESYSSNRGTYGFRINLNIFDGFSRERSLVTAKVNRNNAAAYLAETKNLVTSDIKSAYYEITQYRESKRVANENVESATEDLKITQEKYNLGAATILDLLNSQVSLKRTQVSLIQADFDLNLSIAKLENAMGKM
jgi:outer membrane protein